MTRPRLTDRVHRTTWTTADLVEQIAFDGGYDLEVGRDSDGDYEAVVTREGCEFRARIEAVA